jgi:leucyl aminopeptidase
MALEVACLGALQGLWKPLEAREHNPDIEKVGAISVYAPDHDKTVFEKLNAIEAGRRLARDLCGTEAERMTPQAFAALVKKRCVMTGIEIAIEDKITKLQREYPLLMAVARASIPVPRHRPCVLRLSWRGGDTTDPHLFLAGKGVTYDTGGADLKTGGHMAGMSRDKGGGAGVAGIVLAAALMKAKINITAEIGLVRNSIGAECFVTDEIITGHGGKRVRIGNTDAEGRLVLADCLSHLREKAIDTANPYLFTVATLTGHAVIAVGPYTALLDNGPAHSKQVADRISNRGAQWGEPMEISTLRREDISFVDAKTPAADLLSCNSAPSSRTPRGHQFPAAFLLRASGLEEHGTRSAKPLPYTHVDIAGSAVTDTDWAFGTPTGSPVVSFIARWCMQ